MAIQMFDGLSQAHDFTRSEWDGTFSNAGNGRDGSPEGSVTLSNTARTLLLPTPAATLIWGIACNALAAAIFGNTSSPPLRIVRSGTTELIIQFNSTGFIEVRRTSGTGTLLATSSGHQPLGPTGGWFHLEIKATLHASNGSVTIRLNGLPVLSVSGVATAGTTGNVTAIQFATAGANNSLYFDDLVISDTTDGTATQGRPNNDFLGDLKVAFRVPDAPGDSTQWTPSSGANWAAVDEIPTNTSDYVQSGTAGHTDLYSMQDLAVGAGNVFGVQAMIYGASTDAGTVNVRGVVKENGVTSESSLVQFAGVTYGMRWTTPWWKRPSDSALWTAAGVNAMQAGVRVS